MNRRMIQLCIAMCAIGLLNIFMGMVQLYVQAKATADIEFCYPPSDIPSLLKRDGQRL